MFPNGAEQQMFSPLGALPAGWRLIRLKEIATKIGSGATPRGGTSVYLASRQNHVLIRSQNVFDRHFSTEGLVFISDQHALELRNVRVQPTDILLNITGDGITFARACLAPAHILPACVNQHVAIIRPDLEMCIPGYLLSFLTHPQVKAYIESFNAGGSRRAITKGHIEAFAIPLPPLAEQRAIANILGALDDKIELNRRMNETLESMARALFASWFVDFDPVGARMEGRQPSGMDAETAALFPCAFADTLVGEIPQGWPVKTYGSTIKLIGGGTPKTSVAEYWGGDIPWFSVVDAPRTSDVFVVETEKYITRAGLTSSSTRLLPPRTSIISARGTVGRCALTGAPMAMNQSCYGVRSHLESTD